LVFLSPALAAMAIPELFATLEHGFASGSRLDRRGLRQPMVDFLTQKFLTDGMSASIASLSAQQLRRAADIKDKIQSLEKELEQILGSSSQPVAADAPKKRRKMSAAGRARISAAAKARWAKVKAAQK
jgi:hypothetical protein